MTILPGKRAVIGLLAVLAVACWFPGQAAAYTSIFNWGNLVGTSYPYAELSVTTAADGSSATISIKADSGYYLLDRVGLNLFEDVVTPTATNLNMSFTGAYGAPQFVGFMNSNVDGFGKFDLVMRLGSGTSDSFTGVQFTLLPLDGTFANADSVLNLLAKYDAVIGVGIMDGTTRTSTTGFAAESPDQSGGGTIPVPPTVWLLGSGLLGLGLIRWRRKTQ
jgi:hypothetical protein